MKKSTIRELFKFAGILYTGLSIMNWIAEYLSVDKDNLALLIIGGILIIAIDVYLKEE